MSLSIHPAFELTRKHSIDSLNLTFEEYHHLATGAQHIHLQADNKENVFMVALRTVPEDSTGVAHILEHTALCGSEKFPVRDPFFMMTRRSLNTFMNAMTSSDWTAYPFASQNFKDFQNLLEVYLDSVFFAQLDPLDFAQEGHRLEFSDPLDCESELMFKGVVFNEMKGAMSSTNSILWQTLTKFLYPTNTYHYNSGGDPAHIPDLTYQQFMDFYTSHYHPSNAIFMTYGNIPALDHQERFQELALRRFKNSNCNIAVQNEKRYETPQYFRETYAVDKSESCEKKTHIIVAWLLGDSTDLESTMEARLLASVLLDNSGSPLMNVLESTNLGSAPSPMCGLEDSQKQLCFACGIEGSEEADADEVEAMILAVVQSIAHDGISFAQVSSSLHQIELQQREVSGGGYPYGLGLMLTALTGATHRGDSAALLDLDPVLLNLHERIKDPEYIKSLAKTLLLENTHRIRLVMPPDTELGLHRDQSEKDRLKKLQSTLSESDKKTIVNRSKALKIRQETAEDLDILPKVTLADVPADISYPEKISLPTSKLSLAAYGAGTNGLVYQQIIIPFPKLDDDQMEILPLYTQCVSQLGVGELTYKETQLWQASIVGSYSVSASVRADKENLNMLRGNICFSVKGLARNQKSMTQFLHKSLHQVKFSELSRIRELIAQIRAGKEASLTGNGHVLAMAAAASGFSPSAYLNHQWNGLPSISRIKGLDNCVKDDGQLQDLARKLKTIHNLVLEQKQQHLLVAESQKIDSYVKTIESVFHGDDPVIQSKTKSSEISYKPQLASADQCWTTNTQISFCAKAYPTVPSMHPDSAALTVLGGVLRNGYLHTKIREQGGAYGGGASQDNQNGTFRFFSYRDPRIAGTLTDFNESIDWLLKNPISREQIDEAILGVISNLDKPGSPAGEAISTFHGELNGRNKGELKTFRNRVLSVTDDDLRRVAKTYLKNQEGSCSVITNSSKSSETEMTIINV